MIFDFDGVVVDSEPVHFRCFRDVLETVSVELTRHAYYNEYLGYDDHDCLRAVLDAQGIPHDESQIAALIAAKTVMVQRAFAESIRPLPGAVELISSARAAEVPLAICSGALREEIELAARTVGVLESFAAIVAAEDVQRGKPDPEGYRLALERLCQITGRRLRAEKSVVVEDAPAGIDAARAAGMKVLAVATSYPAEALSAADRVTASLADATVASLEELFQ